MLGFSHVAGRLVLQLSTIGIRCASDWVESMLGHG
jgi:hypothetical protein